MIERTAAENIPIWRILAGIVVAISLTCRARIALLKVQHREEYMRTCGMSALALVLWAGTACAQGAGGAAAPPAAPKDKAGYFANSDIRNIWRDLEARQVLNKRDRGNVIDGTGK
jgi:hypothetical protein